MLRVLALLLFATAVQRPVVAQATAPGPTTPAPEFIIDQIKKCVVFLQGSYNRVQIQVVNGIPQQQTQRADLFGTGFLIFSAESRLGSDRGITFLVTNKHLIREPDSAGQLGLGPYFSKITARVNTKQAHPDGTQYETVELGVVDDAGNLGWLIDPDDDAVDLAITPINLKPEVADFKTVGTDLLATKDLLKKEQINENDEVLFSGLFAWHPGAKKNYPIVRHGKLAQLAEERIPLDRTHPDKTVDVHLADVMSFGGNSGSPVFLRVGGVREPGMLSGYRYYLLGVMQGYFPENIDVAVHLAEVRGVAAQNSGIAAVIPADKIQHILDIPRARAYRERVVAQSLAAAGHGEEAEKSFNEAISLLEKSAPEHA